MERDVPVLKRFDGLGMDHLRTAVGQFDGISHRGGRIVRPLAADRSGRPVLRRTDEALADINARVGGLHERNEPLGRALQIHIRILMAGGGHEALPHIHPSIGHPLRGEVFRNDGGGDELSVPHDPVVPHLVIAHGGIRRGDRLLELHIETGHAVGQERPAPQLFDDAVMEIHNLLQPLQRLRGLAIIERTEQLFEGVGHLSHGGYDHEESLLFGPHDRGDVAHSGGILHRCAAELIYFHLVNLAFCILRYFLPAGSTAGSTARPAPPRL